MVDDDGRYMFVVERTPDGYMNTYETFRLRSHAEEYINNLNDEYEYSEENPLYFRINFLNSSSF